MSRGWLAFGALLALIAAAAGGFAYGVHVTRTAWHLSDSRRQAQDYKAQIREQARVHATDLTTDAIDTHLAVQLARLKDVAPSHQEITRHALAQAPDLHRAVLPAALVRLRREQAQASAAIAAEGAKLGRHPTMQGAGP